MCRAPRVDNTVLAPGKSGTLRRAMYRCTRRVSMREPETPKMSLCPIAAPPRPSANASLPWPARGLASLRGALARTAQSIWLAVLRDHHHGWWDGCLGVASGELRVWRRCTRGVGLCDLQICYFTSHATHLGTTITATIPCPTPDPCRCPPRNQ